ncbi:MAG TPA: DNA adenine methylase, partial [Chloroflexi bacterium]|nr:DNA adenine methylase [Chloroflexota bacterium]
MTTLAPPAPILRYHGAKWKIAPWIIQHFPPHTTYVEVFGGSAGVLLRKPPAPIEVYNDLDGEVVNFFRVLRERPEELARAVEFTPYARAE